VMVESLERRIEEARAKGATVIIFDMDTPGGLVDSSIRIADLIKNLSDIKTVAWVNPNAHSGGAIVAVACDEIVMARSSRIGDAQVITIGPGGAAAVPEELKAKAYTPVINEFRASARLNGYSLVLAEAFVIPDREVWWLENIETKERKFVFREEKNRLLGERVEATIQSAESAEGDEAVEQETSVPEKKQTVPAPEWKLVEKYYDSLLDMEVEARQPVVPDDELLEMSAGEAQAYGFSKGLVVDEATLSARYNLTSVFIVAPSWSEVLADWMTSIYVRGFLLMIILLGAYVEFHTPGVGVAGLVALIALAVFVGAPYLTGLANVWEIVFIVAGVALMALEIFVIPGFGVAGISGVLLVVIGLLATFVPDEPGRQIPLYIPSLESTWRGLQLGVITLVSSAAASLVGIFMLSKYLPRMPLFRRIVPANPTPSEVLVDDPYRGQARIGDIGISEGPLRPSGKARFGSTLVDVVTQGDYLDAHVQIEVIERRGNRVVVRMVT
jgi:membrane-bound serine protease (ClpP class)